MIPASTGLQCRGTFQHHTITSAADRVEGAVKICHASGGEGLQKGLLEEEGTAQPSEGHLEANRENGEKGVPGRRRASNIKRAPGIIKK